MFYTLKKYIKILKKSLKVKDFIQINQTNDRIGYKIRGKMFSNDFIIQIVNCTSLHGYIFKTRRIKYKPTITLRLLTFSNYYIYTVG